MKSGLHAEDRLVGGQLKHIDVSASGREASARILPSNTMREREREPEELQDGVAPLAAHRWWKMPGLALRRHGKVAYGKCPGWRCAVAGRWRLES